jgi:hypothetical protein
VGKKDTRPRRTRNDRTKDAGRGVAKDAIDVLLETSAPYSGLLREAARRSSGVATVTTQTAIHALLGEVDEVDFLLPLCIRLRQRAIDARLAAETNPSAEATREFDDAVTRAKRAITLLPDTIAKSPRLRLPPRPMGGQKEAVEMALSAIGEKLTNGRPPYAKVLRLKSGAELAATTFLSIVDEALPGLVNMRTRSKAVEFLAEELRRLPRDDRRRQDADQILREAVFACHRANGLDRSRARDKAKNMLRSVETSGTF